jgi:ankyrin
LGKALNRGWPRATFARLQIKPTNSITMKSSFTKSVTTLTASILLAVLAAGCEEKSATSKAVEKTETTAKEAGEAIKDAAHKTGEVVSDTAEKAWDKTKEGAKEVSKVATNVAGEIKQGAEKVGDKIQEATK